MTKKEFLELLAPLPDDIPVYKMSWNDSSSCDESGYEKEDPVYSVDVGKIRDVTVVNKYFDAIVIR